MRTKAVLRVLGARLGFPVPLAVGFEITHLCNLSCHYCDRHTPLPNEMTARDAGVLDNERDGSAFMLENLPARE